MPVVPSDHKVSEAEQPSSEPVKISAPDASRKAVKPFSLNRAFVVSLHVGVVALLLLSGFFPHKFFMFRVGEETHGVPSSPVVPAPTLSPDAISKTEPPYYSRQANFSGTGYSKGLEAVKFLHSLRTTLDGEINKSTIALEFLPISIKGKAGLYIDGDELAQFLAIPVHLSITSGLRLRTGLGFDIDLENAILDIETLNCPNRVQRKLEEGIPDLYIYTLPDGYHGYPRREDFMFQNTSSGLSLELSPSPAPSLQKLSLNVLEMEIVDIIGTISVPIGKEMLTCTIHGFSNFTKNLAINK